MVQEETEKKRKQKREWVWCQASSEVVGRIWQQSDWLMIEG